MTSRTLWIAMAMPIAILGVIAGSDGLFLRAVPLEQRLISHDEAIRKKAQQTLLGQSTEQKEQLVARLIPALSKADPFARKWAAIAFALTGPAAQGAIPALLQNVSDKETDVSQAARVALTEIGAPDASQLPVLTQALSDSNEETRCEAAASIAKSGPVAASAIGSLLAVVQRDAPVPECFTAALATLNDFVPHIEVSLSAALHDSDASVRMHAADVLGRIPGKSSATLETLLQGLGRETADAVRPRLAAALNLEEVPPLGLLPALTAGVRQSTDANVRSMALSLLKKSAPSLDMVRPSLVHALRDDDVEIRQTALQWIIRRPEWTRAFENELFQRLKDAVASDRRLALEALYHVPWRGREHLQSIALAQRDNDAAVRCLAVRELVEMGAADRVAIDRLVDDLREESDPACAVDALALTGFFNPDAVATAIRLADEKNDWRTRTRALSVLLMLGGKARAALPVLLRAQREQIPGADNAVLRLRAALAHEKHRRR